MDMVTLVTAARDTTITPKALRRQGRVPCIVYGNEMQATAIQCEEKDLHKAFVKAGESTLVELDIGGKKVPVLFKEVTFHPVTSREVHADFYAVNMKEEIETDVPVHLEGESPAVKELAGILVTPLDHVTVKCLPSDLPHALTIDISLLAAFHDVVTVASIKVPKGVTILNDPETVLATVQEPRAEEVIAPVAAAVDPTAAPAEGAAATGEAGATPAAGEKTEEKKK